jgi:hypothetical protein
LQYIYYIACFVVPLLLVMAKETRKQKDDRELKALGAPLTDDELQVIRKLNGATYVPGYEGMEPSRRTVEAVLQGRRINARLMQRAIYNAKEKLQEYTRIMEGILKKLQG